MLYGQRFLSLGIWKIEVLPLECYRIKRYFLLVLIFSGAIGNMIDRIRLSYVVDFFYFVLIDFPIFNMADIYVSVACVLLAVLLLFVYKDEDLEFISLKDFGKR